MNRKIVRNIFGILIKSNHYARCLGTSDVSTSLWSHLLSNDVHSKTLKQNISKDDFSIHKLRDALVESKQPRKSIGNGDILPETIAKDFVSFYDKLECKTEKLEVFTTLAKDFGLNHDRISGVIENLNDEKKDGIKCRLRVEEELQNSLEPPYIILLSYIGRLEGGVKFIVDMRKDLLEIISDYCDNAEELSGLNQNIRHLLSMWFTAGFLKIERITWKSPCDITEKVANYEAVHEVRNWMDMKKRIGPYRRCYVFLHPSMPRDPVCVLHVALRNEVPSSIQKILNEEIPIDEDDIELKNTAVFYSVSSTQKGLAEIDLGNSLIKEAVKELKHDVSSIDTFVTLSPIPGFYKWFNSQLLLNSSESSLFSHIMDHESHSQHDREIFERFLNQPNNLSLKNIFASSSWLRNMEICDFLREPLMEICAGYLYHEKNRGFACDPVANFHLRNGAALWRLNWRADVSRKGAFNSLGMMVNYKYEVTELDENTRQYFLRGKIPVSQDFLRNLPQL